MGKGKYQSTPRTIGETKSIDIVGIVSDLNPNNIDAAFASFGEVEESSEKEVVEKETSTNVETKESDEKEKSPVSRQDKESEGKSVKEETNEGSDGNAFAYKSIIKKSVSDNNTFKQFWLREDTIDMLDAICRGADCQTSRNAIVHNLVSAFLNENLSLLKKNYEAKTKQKKKKDYLK